MNETEIRLIPHGDKCIVLYLDEMACANGVDDGTTLTAFCVENYGRTLSQLRIRLVGGKPVLVQACEE